MNHFEEELWSQHSSESGQPQNLAHGPGNKPDHSVTIYVKGRPFKWDKRTITFEEVIALAYGAYDPDPRIAYTVSFFDGPRGHEEGVLTKGKRVPVKEGEKFNADRTNNS